jgi:hypothetical protein
MPNKTDYTLQMQIIDLLTEPLTANAVGLILGKSHKTLMSVMQAMTIDGILKAQRTPHGTVYTVVPKAATAPRFMPTGEFRGVDWSRSVMRPGCQDALLCPSRRGDLLVPHTGKLITALGTT